MKSKIPFLLTSVLAMASASAQGLYYIDSEAQESIPLKWVVGTSVIYDDNVGAGNGSIGGTEKQDSFAVNPYVGVSFVNMTPQTTIDVFARLGVVCYLDAPAGMDDINSSSRAGINITHNFSERLRWVSRNFVSYELEPDYSYGVASSRQTGAYLYWYSDNSLGFRWTERFGTYTGVRFNSITYPDITNNDRFTTELYNQARYQLTPQTVLTFDTRYSMTSASDSASDYNDTYLLVGAEHRFSPTTVGVVRAGLQQRDSDQGDTSDSPYVEFALNSRINQQFSVRSYARYGIEGYDTVQFVNGGMYEYDNRQTLRIGVSGDYAFSDKFSLFGGVDYIPTSFQSGRNLAVPGLTGPDLDEDLINAHIGVSCKFTQYLTGSLTYNYTTSSSDIAARDYDRNRITLGLSAEF